jgi:MinD-like ATPase involved in chromosome partitioning or flagellar assembly
MGRIITFYSYKGGVGRSMALSNVGLRLAQGSGLSVTCIDWDLEAPSLHQYFDVNATRSGLIDLLYKDETAVMPSAAELKAARRPSAYESLHVLPAGGIDTAYARKVGVANRLSDAFLDPDWSSRLKKQLREVDDIVLIDSRTGFVDSGYLCAGALSDAVVMMISPSEQALIGVRDLAQFIRGKEPNKQLWLAVSRLPLIGEVASSRLWLTEHSIDHMPHVWRPFDHPHGLATFAIPHSGRWTIGENLVADPDDPVADPLSLAYDKLAQAIAVWHRRGQVTEWLTDLTGAPTKLDEELEAASKRGELPWLAMLSYVRGRRQPSSELAKADFERAAYLSLGLGQWELYLLARQRLPGWDTDALAPRYIQEGKRILGKTKSNWIEAFAHRCGVPARDLPAEFRA